jgi:glycerophosphoryl diester phosphodiesterase
MEAYMKKFYEPEPLIISTGGGMQGLAQDTIKNFNNAMNCGADVIRSNVSITRDKKIVLFGNIVFQNHEISKSGISFYNLKDLRTLYKQFLENKTANNSNEDIEGVFPELSDVLVAFPNQRFNFHFAEKNQELVATFCELVARMSATDRILASSLSGADIKKIRSVFPDMATSFSFAGIVGFYALYRTGLMLFKKKFKADALIIHEMIGASYLASTGMIGNAKKRGIRVYVLNVNTEEQARRLLDAGINGFITDSIEIVERVINN